MRGTIPARWKLMFGVLRLLPDALTVLVAIIILNGTYRWLWNVPSADAERRALEPILVPLKSVPGELQWVHVSRLIYNGGDIHNVSCVLISLGASAGGALDRDGSLMRPLVTEVATEASSAVMKNVPNDFANRKARVVVRCYAGVPAPTGSAYESAVAEGGALKSHRGFMAMSDDP